MATTLFTSRPLIEAMVDLMHMQPSQMLCESQRLRVGVGNSQTASK